MGFLSGQIAVETLFAVGLVLVFFIIAIEESNQIQFSNAAFSDSAADGADCVFLSQVVSAVFNAGPGTQIRIPIETSADFFSSSISVNGSYCFFSAVASDSSVVPGTAVFSNRSGVVEVANES